MDKILSTNIPTLIPKGIQCRPMKWDDLNLPIRRKFRNWLAYKIFKKSSISKEDYRWYHALFGFEVCVRTGLSSPFRIIYTEPSIPPADQDYQDSMFDRWCREMEARIEDHIKKTITGELDVPYGRVCASVKHDEPADR